ncbi:MAG: HD domain-containing protein [Gammaproteobacteria bacterium]|nr:HD domain-containing protein [Gammaproteobacteria bacterium]
MSEHHDILESLNRRLTLKQKVLAAHESVKQLLPFIARIAITLYDPETRVLKTYLHSSDDNADPLSNYQALIDEAPSLKAMLDKGLPRVINNMVTLENGKHEHTRRIGRFGYAASYTLPMFSEGDFVGFIFFNSSKPDVLTEPVLAQLDIFGHMLALMVINEINSIDTLSAAVKTTGRITHQRDPETGSHLDRMSRYSLLIARTLSGKFSLDDDYIQHLFMFAPLHDIGKVVIPDRVLLKPGPLDDEEAVIMRTHSTRGREMIDDMIANFGMENIQHIDLLRNIAHYHHEAVNGTGYPAGLSGSAIPIEARIVAVADVFDALTSERPYKKAWSNEDAVNLLEQLAGEKLDRDCVEALLQNMDEVLRIQSQFSEDIYG